MPDAPTIPVQRRQRFYTKRDWLAATVTGALALVAYFCTLAPSVTFNTAGELTTVAFQLGVAQPPGAPLWTFSAWLWCHLLPVGNIAWRLNLFSAVTSALACGLVALLVSKSGRMIGVRAGVFRVEQNRLLMEVLVPACAICAGLLLACSPVLWSQATVTATAGITALIWMATLVVLYRWSFQPENFRWLYLAAGLWGASVTTDFSFALLAVTGVGYWWRAQSSSWMRQWRPVLRVTMAVMLGGASAGGLVWIARTNPPVNWGDCTNWRNWLEYFSGGLFSRLQTGRMLWQGWSQFNLFFKDLQQQFNLVYALLVLPVVFFYRDLAERDRRWIQFLTVAFLCFGCGFLFLSQPADAQFLPGDCLYAIGIGYGLLLGLSQLFLAKPRLQIVAIPVAVLVVLLPAASVFRNGPHSEKFEHDFAYRLGYLLFEPGGEYPNLERDAVLFSGTDDSRFLATHMVFVESCVAENAKSEVEKCTNSAAFDRRDVYLLTQNSLSEPTYLTSLHNQYGPARLRRAGREDIYPTNSIWLPAGTDVQQAHKQYLNDYQKRAPLPGEAVSVDQAGRVRVTGLTSLMAVNGLLAREIFDHNKDRHAFYIAESLPIQWMQPYLEPYGLIFKLNAEPLADLSSAIVAHDKAYWNALSDDLLGDPRFRRDAEAKKVFSRLRTASAGLYVYRQMWEEAEYAFLQALALYPDNPDTNYRFAQFYVDRQRCNDALEILEQYRRLEPRNPMIQEALAQVKKRRTEQNFIADLERQHTLYPEKFDIALQLARAYAGTHHLDAFDALVKQLTDLPELPEREFFSLIDLDSQLKRADPMLELLEKFTQHYPKNPTGWFNLALMQGMRANCAAALPALERALTLDPQLATAAQQDQRLESCRSLIQALRVTGPPKTNPPPAIVFKPAN